MSDARLTGLLFAAALLARTVAALGSAIFGTDGGHYLLMADWMREGRVHDALSLTYHPLYPLLIAVVRPLAASTEHAGEAVSVVLGAGAVIPFYAVVQALFGRPAAVLTGLLYAFGPMLVEVQSDVMTEGTYLFFSFSSLWLTWKMAQEPTLARGVVLGLSAGAAFLTRTEGLLSVALALAWPVVFSVRHRSGLGTRIAGIALTAAALLLVLSPYLFWVKAQRGHWALSARPSVISSEKAVGVGAAPAEEESPRGSYYRQYGKGLFRLSGLLIPFYLLGLPALGRLDRLRAALYFSFPLGQLLGVLVMLRRHDFMSDRYLLTGMTLLLPVAALGLLSALGWLSRRKGVVARPAFGAALLLAIAVLPGLRCLKLRRQECLSYPLAAQWILAQGGPRPKGLSGPVEQVAYLTGSRSYYAGSTAEQLRGALKVYPIEYFVYSEKDVRGRSDYVAMLRSFERLEAPVTVDGPPGTWKVYIQRVK